MKRRQWARCLRHLEPVVTGDPTWVARRGRRQAAHCAKKALQRKPTRILPEKKKEAWPRHARTCSQWPTRPSTSALRPMPGAQHFVRSANGELLAVLGFGAAAWKIAPWDKLVGADCRRRNLPFVVHNARFGPESNILHPLAQVERRLFARRLGTPLRPASRTA